MTSRFKYLIMLFPMMGVFLCVAGLKYRRHLKSRTKDWVGATGTVVGNVKGFGGGFDTTPVHRPVVEYSLRGQRFTFTAEVGYGRRLKEGTKLAILYNPAEPAMAFILKDYLFAANGILALGVVFVLFGSLLAYELIWAND
jgi:hypothetical protein